MVFSYGVKREFSLNMMKKLLSACVDTLEVAHIRSCHHFSAKLLFDSISQCVRLREVDLAIMGGESSMLLEAIAHARPLTGLRVLKLQYDSKGVLRLGRNWSHLQTFVVPNCQVSLSRDGRSSSC